MVEHSGPTKASQVQRYNDTTTDIIEVEPLERVTQEFFARVG